MEQLFAPWRIEWVERSPPPDAADDCVFCQLPGEEDATEALVVARSPAAYVLLNNYPYNPGHAMVIPDAHAGDYRALDEETLLDHARLLQRTLDAMEAAFGPDGYNVGLNLGGSAAGGSVDDHLHSHVVPRWTGDTNFMAVIAETTVIVEALADSYDRLHEAFLAQDGTEALDDGSVRIDG